MLSLVPTKRLVARIQKEIFFYPQQLQIPSPLLPSQKKSTLGITKNRKIPCWATLSCIYDVISLHVGQKLCDLKTTDEKVTNLMYFKTRRTQDVAAELNITYDTFAKIFVMASSADSTPFVHIYFDHCHVDDAGLYPFLLRVFCRSTEHAGPSLWD